MTNIRLDFRPVVDSSTDNLLIGGDYYPKQNTTTPLASTEVETILDHSKAAVVNLEAPVQTQTSPINKYGPTLSITGESIDLLSESGINFVTLANNHIMDYGGTGVRNTTDRLAKRDIDWTGAGKNRQEAFAPITVTIGNHEVRIINAADREFGIASESDPGYAWIGDDSLFDFLRSPKNDSDVTILVLHGGIEYEPIPAAQRRKLYRKFAETNVDAIIGHHPHVPKGWEMHEGTPICYSLGHFLFDFGRKSRKPKTEWGLLADVRIESGAVEEVVLIPIQQCREGPRVRLIEESSPRNQYLEACRAILEPESIFDGLWQELAVDRYEEYYGGRLRGTVRSQVLGESSERYRWLQNISQCESHRWCIQTATRVLGNTVQDERSAESAELLGDLRKQTRDSIFEQALRKFPMLSEWYEQRYSRT